MSKKGFAFVETIVTLTILLVALTALYAVFANLLNQEKVMSEYDRPSDKYSLYYIKEMWLKEDKSSYNASNPSYSKYKDYFNASNVLVFKCKDKKVNLNNYNLDSFRVDFRKYIEDIKICPSEQNEYVFFGEFKTGKQYTYAHIYYPNLTNDEEL